MEPLAVDVNVVMISLHNDLVGMVMVVVGFWRSDWRTTDVYMVVIPFDGGLVEVMTAVRGPVVSCFVVAFIAVTVG